VAKLKGVQAPAEEIDEMIRSQPMLRTLALLLTLLLAGGGELEATPSQAAPSKAAATQSSSSGGTAKPAAKSTATKPKAKKSTRPRGIPTYADSTADDIPEFDDPMVRQAAVQALGRYNGTVVVADPNTGRILSIVNQRLAFSAGFQPCSTFKPVVAVAALNEGVVTRDTMVKVARRSYMNLTEAMAHSNNPYFEVLGRQMGFETVSRYAHLFGLGEPAGYNIFEEHPGVFPAEPPRWGGVGKMSSFGEGIQLTPLQLASLAVTFANGGTLYYLQYPRTEEERRSFTPRVKRRLGIAALLPDLREGMLAAVLYGTGRRGFDPAGEQMLGKTGTCNDQGSRLGWFFSYSDQLNPRLVVAVLIRGQARRVNGATAADIAGRVYTILRERNYFALHNTTTSARASH
jgi:cell division protein FtsI/penicillin-binding protein 2